MAPTCPLQPEQPHLYLRSLLGFATGLPLHKRFHSPQNFENAPLVLVWLTPELGTEKEPNHCLLTAALCVPASPGSSGWGGARAVGTHRSVPGQSRDRPPGS